MEGVEELFSLRYPQGGVLMRKREEGQLFRFRLFFCFALLDRKGMKELPDSLPLQKRIKFPCKPSDHHKEQQRDEDEKEKKGAEAGSGSFVHHNRPEADILFRFGSNGLELFF